jgi:hypothetical protein
MRIVFVHTVTGVVPMFAELIRKHLPSGVEVLHIADETMIAAVRAAGGPTEEVAARLAGHVEAAARAGASAVQVTCSTISPCVRGLGRTRIPVFSIDGPMAREAARKYKRIAVLATNRATLKPSVETIRQAARDAKRVVKVRGFECDAAYKAFLAGDMASHNRIVIREATRLAKRVDAVVLAQASMAGLAGELSSLEAAILTSPGPAMKHLAGFIRRREARHETGDHCGR